MVDLDGYSVHVNIQISTSNPKHARNNYRSGFAFCRFICIISRRARHSSIQHSFNIFLHFTESSQFCQLGGGIRMGDLKVHQTYRALNISTGLQLSAPASFAHFCPMVIWPNVQLIDKMRCYVLISQAMCSHKYQFSFHNHLIFMHMHFCVRVFQL